MSALVRGTQDNPMMQDAREQPLLQVRRIYAGFVQGLFHAAPPGSYHWEPDAKVTEIIITDENPIQVDVVGKRPAVTFTRGPVQFFGLGLDDMISYDQSTGAKKKSILLPGTMTINCCSRNDLESEYLASVIAEQFWMHRELLMRAGFFEIGRNFMIGAPSPAGSIVAGDSADEWYVTSVTSPFHINRTSKFSPLNTRIAQEIAANLSTSPSITRTSTWGPVASPPGNGNPPWQQQYPSEEEQLPKVPHPLDPTKKVSIRSVHPNRPGIRPPAIRGRTIPVAGGDVEGSAKLTFKV
jgi:hypothetical protein